MKTLVSINPATGLKSLDIPVMERKTIDNIIEKSHHLFLAWRAVPLADKLKKIEKLAQLLHANYEEYAKLISTEMGKLYKEAQAEVKKCAALCEFYLQHAQVFLQDEIIRTDYTKSYISYQPLGVTLGIMPWNFPFWQVFRYAVPTLLVGNTVLLKHASNVPQCGQLLESIFHNANIEGFHNLLISSKQIAPVIQHPKVKAVSLTGSLQAGQQVAQLAGACIKKTVLELGGSDPYLILKDADIPWAVEKCVQARLLNAGQSCIAAKRFIIEAAVYDEFVDAFKEKFQTYKPGDPFNEQTNLAPLATESIRSQLHSQVLKSIEKGAQCILGGGFYDQPGFYYQPSILTHITSGMPAYHEELFGPVASMIKVEDEEAAVRVANDHTYGLGSAIFSKNIEKAEYIAKTQLQSGQCFVNEFVKSDPRLPFGGENESGYGRELSRFGILEFTNIKTICIQAGK